MAVKILHVLDHSIPLHSGYTFRTRAILQQQRSMGWQTEQLTSAKQQWGEQRPNDLPNSAAEAADCEQVSGFRFFRTPLNNTWLAGLPLFNQLEVVRGLAQRLEQVIDQVQPDILHAHSPALNGLATLWVGRRRGLPVVYECRAFWEDAAVDHGSCHPRSLRYYLTRALESFVFKRVDAVTTICEGLRADIVARGLAAEKVTVIPNAVDIEQFRCASLVSTEDGAEQAESTVESDKQLLAELVVELGLQGKQVLGFIGSFYAYEGIPLLLQSIPLIIHEQVNVRLLLIGGGPQEALIKQTVKELGLEDKVILMGRLPHADIQLYYDLIDILVYPRLPMRLTHLVTPLKPLEAIAKGVLVMASDVGGHRELIENGVTGRLFQAGSVDDLVRVALDFLAGRDQWIDYRRQARDFVERERSWAKSVSGYRLVYDALRRRA